MAVQFIRTLTEKRRKLQDFIEDSLERVKKVPAREFFLPTSSAFKRVGTPYLKGQIAQPIREGVSTAFGRNKTGFQRAGGALQTVGGLFSATPAGVGFNTLTATETAVAKNVKGKGNIQSTFESGFTKPTSFAQEGLDVKNPLLALGIDLVAGDPRSFLKASKNLFRKPVKSSFRLNTEDLDDLIKSQDILVNPKRYFPKDMPNPSAAFKEHQRIIKQAEETIRVLGLRHLPEKVLGKVGDDLNKMATELYNLSKKNKLGLFQVPGMQFTAGGGKYNLKDLDFSDDVGKVFADVAEKADDLIRTERRGKISFEQTRKAADELFGVTVETLKKKRPGKVLNDAEITRAGDIAKTFFEQELAPLQKAYDEAVKLGSATPQMKAQLLEKMNEGAIIQAKVLGAATELGRALNARKILKQSLKDPSQLKLDKVIKAFGGEEKANAIIKRFNELSLDDPTGRQAYEFLRSLYKSNGFEKVEWYWLNSILSGPRTHEKNAISNAMMVFLRPADKVFASIADLGRVGVGKVFGKNVKRERFFGEAGVELLAIRKGFVDGYSKFMHIMRKGYSLEDAGKLELRRPEPIGGRVIGKNIPLKERASGATGAVVGAPLRFLSASDQLFKSIIFNMEASAMAYRKSAQSGKSLVDRFDDMAEILKNPSEDIIESASQAALKGTFQTEFAEGTLAKRVANLRNWEVKGVRPLKFVIPFIQTPINVMKIGLERGPVTGPMKAVWDIAKSQGGKRSDAMGRLFFSSATLGTLGFLALEGRVSGNGPTNKKDLDLLRETGWQPNSIRLTNPRTGKDIWVSYKGLAPLDQMFSQVASLHERFYIDRELPTEEKVFGVFTDILKNINDQTFMSGLADWLEALNNPESLSTSKFFSRLGASFVIPNALRTVAQTQDRVLRESDTFIQQLQTGIPGLSQDVAPRLNEFDTPIVFEGSALLPVTVSSEKIPAYATREALQIKQNVRRAKKELEQGEAPTALDKGRSDFVTAEYVYSNYKNFKNHEEASEFVNRLKESGILTKEVAGIVDQIQEMDDFGLTSDDREMLLYPPGAVRAQLIIDRYKQFTNPDNREEYLATLVEVGLLDQDTGNALRILNKIRSGKKEKANLP